MAAPDLNLYELRELYEAQAERARACRHRADVTSTYSVLTSSLAIVLCLSGPLAPPLVLIAMMLLDGVFLHIETSALVDSSYLTVHASMLVLRDAAAAQLERKRVMTLPNHWLPLHVARRASTDYLRILRWRIRRTYLWLYSGLLAVWLIVMSSPSTNDVEHPWSLLARVVGVPIAGRVVLGLVCIVYVATFLAAVTAPRFEGHDGAF